MAISRVLKWCEKSWLEIDDKINVTKKPSVYPLQHFKVIRPFLMWFCLLLDNDRLKYWS